MAKLIKMANVKVGDAFFFTDRDKLFVQEAQEDPEDARRMMFRLSNGLVVSMRKSFFWFVNPEEKIKKQNFVIYEVFLSETIK